MNLKSTKLVLIVISTSFLFSSCLLYTSVVGAGAYGDIKKTDWNHYLLFGLIPVSRSDSREMAGKNTDYTVHTRSTVLNYLVYALTAGLYMPTTTTVTVNPGKFNTRE